MTRHLSCRRPEGGDCRTVPDSQSYRRLLIVHGKVAVNAVQHTALKIKGAETIRGPSDISPGHVDSPQASWHCDPSDFYCSMVEKVEAILGRW
jgi:hypothetical protein